MGTCAENERRQAAKGSDEVVASACVSAVATAGLLEECAEQRTRSNDVRVFRSMPVLHYEGVSANEGSSQNEVF